jgi:hypothetical protein
LANCIEAKHKSANSTASTVLNMWAAGFMNSAPTFHLPGTPPAIFHHVTLFDPYPPFRPRDFVFKIASTPNELDGYWALRRAVCCEEQHVFQSGDDRDAIDDHA